MADRMEIELPDGTIVDAPAGTTRAQIDAKFPQFAGNKPSVLAEVGRVADKAVRGGLLALPGLVGDAAVGIPNWLARKAGVLEESQAVGAPGQMMWPSDALKTLTGGELAKPQTEVGKAAGNIGEAIVGTLAGAPGVSSVKGLKAAAPALTAIGAGAGVGGEAAGRLFEDIPLARAAGGLLGGGAVAAKQAFSANNTDKVARTMMEGVSRRDIEDALRMQKESAAAGLDLNLGQAMGRETNIDAVIASLANTTEGKHTTALLRSQPGQIKLGTEMAVQGLPGKVRAELDIANRSQEAATTLIETAKKARSASWRAAFDEELARIQAGPAQKLSQAVALASQRADDLAAAQASDGVAQAATATAKAQRAKVLASMESARNAQAPLPVTVEQNSSGILLPEAQRGQAIINQLATHEARQAQLQDKGTILDASGQPFKTAPTLPAEIAAPALQAPAAEAALQRAKVQVGSAERQLAATTTVPEAALNGVQMKLTKLIEANGNPAVKRSLQTLRDALRTEDGLLADADQLNEVLKYAAHQTKPVNMQTSGLDAGASKYVNGIITGLRDDLGKAFSPYRAANTRFAANTEVDGLKKSFVGTLAGRLGAKDDANAAGNKLLDLLEKGTHPDATRSEILTVARQLNKQDPELFLDAGKTWISNKLTDALNSANARDTASTASRVTHAFGAPGKASRHTKGLSDVLAGMAEAQNLPPSTLQALPKFLNYIAHAVERPSSTQGATGSDIAALAADSIIGRVGHVSMLTAARQPILAYTNRLQANTRAELDRLLTTPEGIRMLHTLSTTSPWTERGQKAISVFLGTNAAAQAGDGGNSPGITVE